MLVYNVVIQAVNEYANNLKLQEKNYQLTMQSLQYENLCDRINEARRANHDFHHHITLMTAYVDKGDFDNLKTLFHSFLRTLPEDSNIIFCEHYALNMLILYYAQLAREKNVELIVDVYVPSKITVSDSDLSVLIGNLLENALDACIAQKNSERQIVLRGRMENSCLLFTIDNTFENDIKKNMDGLYLSTKHSGTGIGIESARAIVERYNGVIRIQQKSGFFYVSVLMNL